MSTSLPSHGARCMRALKMGIAASAGLYLLAAFVAEPLHGLASSSDSETAIVSVTLADAMGLACDATNDGIYGSGETLNLGTITYSGDTGTYGATKQVTCKVTSNKNNGYIFAWQILTGTGAAGARSGTGYLNANGTNRIPPIGTGSTNNTIVFPTLATARGWGGRVSSTSSGIQIGNLDFGTDTSAEKFARVATGSTVSIRQKTTASQQGGDLIRIHFRAYVGASYVQPTGTYQATVTFTSTNY